MNPLDNPTDYILSFRHLLTSAVTEFLAERQMTCPQTAEALSELVVSLSSYREEGSPLFPQVFVCEDITAMLQALRGRDPMSVSDGDRSRVTMRRALKQCAPLSRGGWAIYFQLDEPGRFSYGLFRTDSFILSSTPIELLRAIKDPSIKLLGISRVAENIIELCASAGYRRFIHLSGARTDVPHPTHVLEDIVQAVTADVDEPYRQPAQGFFRHAFFDAMQAPHGSLAMVIPKNAPRSSLLDDGVMLQPSIDVVARIEAYKSDPREEKATSLQAVVTLLHGMLSADGITVLRSDGCLVGYNVFVEQPALREGEMPIGGARRRSFNVLCRHLGKELAAAFYRSQDGVALCERAIPLSTPVLGDTIPVTAIAGAEGVLSDSKPPSLYEPMEMTGITGGAEDSRAPTAAHPQSPAAPNGPTPPLITATPAPAMPQAAAPQPSQQQNTSDDAGPALSATMPLTVSEEPSQQQAQLAFELTQRTAAPSVTATPVPAMPQPCPLPNETAAAPQSVTSPERFDARGRVDLPEGSLEPVRSASVFLTATPMPTTPPKATPNLTSAPALGSAAVPMTETSVLPERPSAPPSAMIPDGDRHHQPPADSPDYPAGHRAIIDALCRNELHPICQMTPSIQNAPPARESPPSDSEKPTAPTAEVCPEDK